MSERNQSGIYPLGYRVLVKPDQIEEVTQGGIIIPETQREGHERAQATGVIVEVGEFAWKDWPARWASVGDRVLFAKYGGQALKGVDGAAYRLLNDEQITAVVSEEVNLSDFKTREKFA